MSQLKKYSYEWWRWSQISFNGNNYAKAKLIWSDLCMSSPSPLRWLVTQHFDDRYKYKESEWLLSQPEHTFWVRRLKTFENPIFTFGCFSLNAVYNPCKLQRLLQVANFLLYVLLYYFTFQAPTYWNFHLHKRLLPDEVFQWW